MGRFIFSAPPMSPVVSRRTDGTSAGTVLVQAGGFGELTTLGGSLYFTGGGLWRSDGTAAGTALVAGSPSLASGLIRSGGSLYFTSFSNELWRSDGTAAGTVVVTAIPALSSGGLGVSGLPLTDVDGTDLFSNRNPSNVDGAVEVGRLGGGYCSGQGARYRGRDRVDDRRRQWAVILPGGDSRRGRRAVEERRDRSGDLRAEHQRRRHAFDFRIAGGPGGIAFISSARLLPGPRTLVERRWPSPGPSPWWIWSPGVGSSSLTA